MFKNEEQATDPRPETGCFRVSAFPSWGVVFHRFQSFNLFTDSENTK